MVDPLDPVGPIDPDAGTQQEPGIRYHLDLDTGTVWESSDDRVWHDRGRIPGIGAGDQDPPGAPTDLTLDDHVDIAPDGTVVTSLVISWSPPLPIGAP